MTKQKINIKQWESNLRAALAAFVMEQMPVEDPYSDDMVKAAWRIAERLEGRLIDELQKYMTSDGEGQRRAQ